MKSILEYVEEYKNTLETLQCPEVLRALQRPDVQKALDDLLEAMRAPGLDDVQRGVLERDYNYLKEKLERFKEERQIYKDYNEAVAGILSESEKEKLSTIINDDGTDSYFDEAAETQDKKEMYLSISENKEEQ